MEKSILLVKIILKSLWLLFAGLIFIGGLIMFIDATKEDDGWTAWFAWGTACALITLINTIKTIITSIKGGAEEGADTYTYENGYISNHPFLGALFGIFFGIFAAILLGPLYLLVKTLEIITSLTDNIKLLREINSSEGDF